MVEVEEPMRPDIDELHDFYRRRPGQLARRLVNRGIRTIWPDLSRLVVVGVGYTAPYLALFDEAEARLALMPATPGGLDGSALPTGCSLTDERQMPLADGSVDRLLLVHAVEVSDRIDRLMREAWRVLADGGRLLAVVPNRRGLWCWSESTPFGAGRPYSAGQLERMLRGHLFEPGAVGRALYMPPTESKLLSQLTVPAERVGLTLARELSGILLVEASKEPYVATPVLARAPHAAKRRSVVRGEVAARRRVVARSAGDSGRGAAPIG